MEPNAGDVHRESLVDWRFSFTEGIKVAFGEGCAARAGREVADLGCERPLVVVDPNASEAGATDSAIDSLSTEGIDYVRFDDVEPNPREETVSQGVALVEDDDLDGVVAVGGGSTIDAGKAISLAVTNDGPIGTYEGVDTFDAAPIPCVAVPTTVGTGSAISQGMVVTDEDGDAKRTMIDERVSPDVALFDPSLLETLPASVLTSTGLDSLAQAIEAYVSTRANPVSEALALHAADVLADSLRPAVADGDPEALAATQQAAIMQALAFTNSGLGLAHGMSNTVGGYFDTPHGLTTAVVLPHVLRFNLVAVPGKYADLAGVMRDGPPADAGDAPTGAGTADTRTGAEATDARIEAERLVEECERLNDDLGVPDRLRELGVERDAIGPMAADAVDHVDSLGNPRSFTEADVRELFERAY